MSGATACIALGSNLGDRDANIRSALAQLEDTSGIEFVAVSDILETPPMGPEGQRAYLNAAVVVQTTHSPRELLDCLLRIEAAHGRQRNRSQRWGPRELDLDLLLYDSLVVDEPGLTVPHPHMHERLFVLEPLAQVAPEMVHPLLHADIKTLLTRLQTAEAGG